MAAGGIADEGVTAREYPWLEYLLLRSGDKYGGLRYRIGRLAVLACLHLRAHIVAQRGGAARRIAHREAPSGIDRHAFARSRGRKQRDSPKQQGRKRPAFRQTFHVFLEFEVSRRANNQPLTRNR
jgi:hypothetical protein